jgi:flavin-dependent dehydrogenase
MACDVLVIGGGPAGSTAAALLAERGRSVVLLEKDAHPRFHIGESLLPQNLAVFERLGLLDEIAKLGVYKPGAEFVSDAHGGKRVVFDFSTGIDQRYTYSFQVRRAEFDALLFDNAKRKGAAAHENVRVVDVQFAPAGGDRRSLVTAEDGAGGQRQWAPRFVIDASGRDTFFAGRSGEKTADKNNSTAAVFAHFRNVARRSGREEGNISVHLFDQGWCWMIPLPDDTMSIGLVSNPDFFKARKADVKALFLDTLAATPSIAARMTDAELISPVTSTGNYSYHSSSMVGDGYILIGDAFAFIDPIFSSGVLLAMTGAVLGADAVEAWLTDPKSAEPLFREFDRRVRYALDSLSWLIYRINTPVLRDMFMEPQNRFRMREGLVSLLAGNVHAPKGLALPVLAFKTAYYFLSAARRLGFRLGSGGLSKSAPASAT